jgi:hypothetical protein
VGDDGLNISGYAKTKVITFNVSATAITAMMSAPFLSSAIDFPAIFLFTLLTAPITRMLRLDEFLSPHIAFSLLITANRILAF